MKNMKTIIDANVILRYILNDNEAMSAKAKERTALQAQTGLQDKSDTILSETIR